MTHPDPTEDDLRAALLTRAPADLDVADFRARVDRVLAATAPATDAPVARLATEPHDPEVHELDALVIPLASAPRARRSTRSRVAFALTAAACLAAISAVVIAVLPSSGSKHNATDIVPSTVKSQLLPGTIVLGTYRGTGSRDIAVPRHTVPKFFTFAVYFSCSGAKNFEVLNAVIKPACSKNGILGTTGELVDGTVPVRTDAGTSWQVTVVIEPELRTNGSAQSPVDTGLMDGPDNGLRHSGHGTETVQLAGDDNVEVSGKPSTKYTVNLVCHGSGVSLPQLSRYAAAGLSTKTCLAGRQYVWDYVPLRLPGSIRVVASPGTTWTISLDPT